MKARARQKQANAFIRKAMLVARRKRGYHLWCTLVASVEIQREDKLLREVARRSALLHEAAQRGALIYVIRRQWGLG